MSFEFPILVTGATGYLASWIVYQLLERGETVHATVRNPDKKEKYQHLLDAAERFPGTLQVFAADLLKEESFVEAMQGCGAVIHTASPFFTTPDNDPQKELVDPALKGTQNVLNTVNQTASVKHVVLTSSVVAIYGDATDLKSTPMGRFTETQWNETSSLEYQPYAYSKTLAEKAAWEICEAQSHWTMNTINPGFILGPSQTPRTDSTSINFMRSMANGTFRLGVPRLSMGMVDVRDVAQAHILALEKQAEGRFILVSKTRDAWWVAQTLKSHFGKRYAFPLMAAPKWMVKIIGPSQGLSKQFVERNVGCPMAFDNTRSIELLGVNYRPIEDTLIEHIEQLENDQLL